MFGFRYGAMPEVRPIRHRALIEWVKEIRNLPRPPLILDYGCGTGHASAAFKELMPAARLHMADIEDIREDCKDLPFALLATDSPKIPLEDGSVDVLFASEVLEHVPNLLGTLLEIHRVLSPKGYLVGSVPNFSHIHSSVSLFRGVGYRNAARLPHGGHLNFITRQYFLKLVSAYFKLVREGGDVDFVSPYFFMPASMRLKVKKAKKPRLGFGRINPKFSCLSYDYLFLFRRCPAPQAADELKTSETE